MKVWIVEEQVAYEPGNIIGPFASKEGAMHCICEYIAEHYRSKWSAPYEPFDDDDSFGADDGYCAIVAHTWEVEP